MRERECSLDCRTVPRSGECQWDLHSRNIVNFPPLSVVNLINTWRLSVILWLTASSDKDRTTEAFVNCNFFFQIKYHLKSRNWIGCSNIIPQLNFAVKGAKAGIIFICTDQEWCLLTSHLNTLQIFSFNIITNALQFVWYFYVTTLNPFNLGFPHQELNYTFFNSVWIFIYIYPSFFQIPSAFSGRSFFIEAAK